MRSTKYLPLCLAGVLFLVSACPIYADVVNQLFVSPNFTGGAGPCGDSLTGPGPIDQACSTTGGFGSTGSGETFVQMGTIKLKGDAFGSLNSVTRGIFRDNVTITSPGIPIGTIGSLTFAIFVDGSFTASATGISQAGWQLQADFGGGAFDINRGGQLNGGEALSPGYHGDAFGTFFGTGSFQYGLTAPVDVELSASSQASFSFIGPGTASHNLFQSLYWGGISDVTANGTPVTSFVISSDSGFNFADPVAVPEPVTAWMLLGACFGFAIIKKCACPSSSSSL